MRALILTAAVLAACFTAGQARAQDPVAPTVKVAAPDDGVLTWDELPADIRRRAEPLIGRPSPQAVLHVENAVVPDSEFRAVDHGDILFEQRIRPAGLARMVRPVRNAEKYGPLGAVLWPAVGPAGDYWCWRRLNPANDFARGNFYCYEDKDHDGTSERLMENPAWMTGLAVSRFQFQSIGHDEGVEESASFEVQPDALGEFEEVVVLRYNGANRGLVNPDGSFGPGTIDFELMTGPNSRAVGEVDRITVRVDADGRGQYHGLNGVQLIVDGVNVDGVARVKILGGLPQGRTLLSPALTREMVIERMSEFLNPDGTPKPRPAGDDSGEESPSPATEPAS